MGLKAYWLYRIHLIISYKYFITTFQLSHEYLHPTTISTPPQALFSSAHYLSVIICLLSKLTYPTALAIQYILQKAAAVIYAHLQDTHKSSGYS
jgi:hypothetical protein